MKTAIRSKLIAIRSWRYWHRALLAGSSALALTVAADPALAQSVVINDEAHEIVDGSGDGTSGTRPSPWEIDGHLDIGFLTNGELTIRNGGTVNIGTLTAVGSAGGDGALTVTGEESRLVVDTVLYVGSAAGGSNGIVTIEAGGGIFSKSGIIGAGAAEGSPAINTGAVTVTGAGSIWSISSNLSIGHNWSNAGILAVENGGTVTASQTYLGRDSASGTLVLSGTNGARGILATGFVEKGTGNARLDFDGGILRATSDEAEFLRNFDAGDVTIGAGGAFIDSNGHDIGIATSLVGTGDLTKLGSGTLTLSGGLAGGNLNMQSGQLRLAGGASSVERLRVDDIDGDEAHVIIQGEDTTLNASAAIYAGISGNGRLNVADGAHAAVHGSYGIVAGYYEGSEGTVIVSGKGSLLETTGDLGAIRIGRAGSGSLRIENGGRVESAYLTVIGDRTTGTGTVTVTGAGSVLAATNDRPMYIGGSGRGSLDILDGGLVHTMYFASLGRQPDGVGMARVSGEGSIWRVRSEDDPGGNLYIGEYGKGTVVLSDGGHIDLGDAPASHVALAREANSSGELVIGAERGETPAGAGTIDARSIWFGAGSGTLVFNHSDDNYVFGMDIRPDPFIFDDSDYGQHGIEHLAGRTVYTGNGSGFDGATTVSGGTFVVDGRLGGELTVESGATLSGSGTIGSGAGSTVTIADGGILEPGSSIGTLTVDGDLTLLSGSILDYELGSAGGDPATGISDRIDVTGDLALNGTLNLSQSNDASDGIAGFGYYRLMTYKGELTDNGLNIGDAPAIDGADYEIQAGGGNVDLFIATLGNDTLQHWQGGNGVWDSTNAQWFNLDGDIPVTWAGNHAVFRNEPGGFNGGTITVEGTQSFKGLQFVDEGYYLEGSGVLETVPEGSEIRVLADSTKIATEITGTGGIVKTQAGTLILSGDNSYAGDTRILGGTLQVSEDANLGATSGGLTINGGVLSATSSFETGRSVTLAGVGAFEVTDGDTLGLTGVIGGEGDLVKRGDGVLRLTGDNAYGNTFVEAGTLTGDAGSILGSIANAGLVRFDQGDDASFVGDIAGLGGTNGAMVKAGAGTLTLGGASTLDWTISEGRLATEAARFAGDVLLDGAGAALSFGDAGSAVYGGAFSGNGLFSFDGTGTVVLTGDSSGFSGRTSIGAGTLLVGDADSNGALGGSFNVLDGATLGGAGTVGSGVGSLVVVASGGTLSPGNSFGTLTVDGDLVFETGSRFAVEVNPEGNESDLVAVTGAATLDGGAVAHIGANGNYDIRSTYTILSAGGGLSGSFDDVISNFAFLTPELIYDYGAGTVDLQLSRNDRDFASVAATRNQIATAGGVESIGFDAGHAIYDAIAQLADDSDLIRASFDALSGEIHGSAKTALIEDSRFIRNAANDRIRAAFGDAGASVAPVLAYGPGDTPVAVSADHIGPVFWSQGFGSWGSSDSDGNAAALDRNTRGLLIGADGLIGDWRLGLLAGYSHSTFKAGDRASSGSSDNYHLGAYGGTQWGNIALRTGVAYSWHDIDTSRPVAIPGLGNHLTADYSAGTFQAFGELGYRLEPGNGIRLEPFANLANVSLHSSSFGEKGGDAALIGHSGSTDATFTTLGLRGEHTLTFGTMGATLKGMIGWRYAFGDTTPESTHAFSAGDAFTIAGVPIAKGSAVIEAGLDLDLSPDARLGFSYTGQLASGAQDHGFKANLAVRF